MDEGCVYTLCDGEVHYGTLIDIVGSLDSIRAIVTAEDGTLLIMDPGQVKLSRYVREPIRRKLGNEAVQPIIERASAHVAQSLQGVASALATHQGCPQCPHLASEHGVLGCAVCSACRLTTAFFDARTIGTIMSPSMNEPLCRHKWDDDQRPLDTSGTCANCGIRYDVVYPMPVIADLEIREELRIGILQALELVNNTTFLSWPGGTEQVANFVYQHAVLNNPIQLPVNTDG